LTKAQNIQYENCNYYSSKNQGPYQNGPWAGPGVIIFGLMTCQTECQTKMAHGPVIITFGLMIEIFWSVCKAETNLLSTTSTTEVLDQDCWPKKQLLFLLFFIIDNNIISVVGWNYILGNTLVFCLLPHSTLLFIWWKMVMHNTWEKQHNLIQQTNITDMVETTDRQKYKGIITITQF
jgi:hypothetical protein